MTDTGFSEQRSRTVYSRESRSVWCVATAVSGSPLVLPLIRTLLYTCSLCGDAPSSQGPRDIRDRCRGLVRVGLWVYVTKGHQSLSRLSLSECTVS